MMDMRTDEARALFQERLCNELDRSTRDVLVNADRLSWAGQGLSAATLDRWIEATGAALEKLKNARRARA
jgi:hypothetical protein